MASTAESEIIKADDRRRAAMVSGDIAMLDAVLAADLVHTHATGRAENKAEYLEMIRRLPGRYRKVERSEERVSVRGDVAWIHGRQRLTIASDGSDRVLDNRFLSIWVAAGGEWRMAAFMTVPIK
jgi:ketosteroid isomerase-like protein